MTSRYTRIPVLLVFLLIAAAASAQVLSVEYAAGGDPTAEGWGTQCPGGAGVGAGFIDDGGTPAWFVDDNTTGSCLWYIKGVPPADVSAGNTTGFVMRGIVRAVDVPDHPHGSPFFKYSNGVRTWEVRFGNQEDGDLLLNIRTSISDDGIYVPVEGSGPGYHDISVAYDPVDALADVYVDGDLILADYAGATFTQGELMGWGAGRSPDLGQGNFNLIQLWVGLTDPVANEEASWGQIKALYGTR